MILIRFIVSTFGFPWNNPRILIGGWKIYLTNLNPGHNDIIKLFKYLFYTLWTEQKKYLDPCQRLTLTLQTKNIFLAWLTFLKPGWSIGY